LARSEDGKIVRFEFTAEQRDLASMARQVAADLSSLAGSGDTSDSGGAAGSGRKVDFGLLVDTGLCGLLIPESQGGVGATAVEAAIVAEELGRALVPTVVAGSFLISPAALELVADATTRDQAAERIAAGRPCSVVVGPDLSWPPAGAGLAWAWHPEAIVLSPGDGGLVVSSEEGYVARPTADPTLEVAAAGAAPDLGAAADSDGGQRFLAVANIVTSCLLLGHMRATLDRSVAYALDREQFGEKIGSFQAVKHLCADMLVDTESAHSVAYGAAATVAQAPDAGTASRAAAVAKAWCGDAAIRVCESAIQVHGGLGFTWEVPVHRYLRAAHVVRLSFMSPAAALDLITELDRWT
jgi:alkylation response protein AidB-like acyl-CoA dehydrogenase